MLLALVRLRSSRHQALFNSWNALRSFSNQSTGEHSRISFMGFQSQAFPFLVLPQVSGRMCYVIPQLRECSPRAHSTGHAIFLYSGVPSNHA